MDLQIEHPELQGWPRLVGTWSVEARHPLLPVRTSTALRAESARVSLVPMDVGLTL
jgi:hypothetical protein